MRPLFIPFLLAFFSTVGCSDATQQSNLSDEQLRRDLQNALQAQDYDSAYPIIATLIERNPDNFDLFVARASIHMLTGRGEKSNADFARCLALDKDKGERARFFVADRVVWKARELSMARDNEGAIRLLDAVIAVMPEAGMAYHDRGGAKLDLGDFAGAVEDLTLAIKHDQGNNRFGDSYTLRSRAYSGLGNEESAVADKALALEQQSRGQEQIE